MPKSRKTAGRNDFLSYFNPKHPGSYCGVTGFLKNNKVNSKKFKKWAEKENTLTLHKNARKHFPRRRVLVFSTGELMQIDLVTHAHFPPHILMSLHPVINLEIIMKKCQNYRPPPS